MPPTKPTTPVLEDVPAMKPTRYEPSCSRKTKPVVLLPCGTASITANFVFGDSLATVVTADSLVNPTPTINCTPPLAILRTPVSICVGSPGTNSLMPLPNSFEARSRPSKVRWLNERSFLIESLNTTPTSKVLWALLTARVRIPTAAIHFFMLTLSNYAACLSMNRLISSHG